MCANNLYELLQLDKSAQKDDIIKAYKNLALKYHPDKNKSNNSDMFNKIKIAYDILSNNENRKKYDSLSQIQHLTMLNLIYNFINYTKNPKFINKIINSLCNDDPFLINEFNSILDYDTFKCKYENKLKNKINIKYINELAQKLIDDNNELSIFIPITENYDLSSGESKSYSNNTITKSNDMNIIGEIKTNLEEIYNNCVKEITVKRQLIEDNKVIFKNFKYYVSVLNDKSIYEKEGDQYLDSNGSIKSGNLIIYIICKKHKYYKRVNDNDIFISLPITMYELFNGFNKKFKYFNNQIISLVKQNKTAKITSNHQIFNIIYFDGVKIVVVLSNLGTLLYNNSDKRGYLIIYLILMKPHNFDDLLKKYF